MLAPDVRAQAMYISKCVAACAVGLFDAALNYLWDETIANLREKVTRFDIDYFFDSTVTDPNRRRLFQEPKDFEKLDDYEFIRGCNKIGILSDIGYKHVDYIRDMRNWASAAHPNQNELSGLQLVSWMETCIREVFAKEPEAPAIEVKQLLANVRTKVLQAADVVPINKSIGNLPQTLAAAFLRATFGMYTDPGMSAEAKNNIQLLAPAVWQRVNEDSRREIGVRYATFAVNGDVPRRDAARAFLEAVGGLGYLPADMIVAEFHEKIANLETAHNGMNNFYSEGPHAKALFALVPQTGVIPDSVRAEYVKTVVRARIGNGWGVSWAGQDYYDRLIARFQQAEAVEFVRLLREPDVQSRLMNGGPADNFRTIAAQLRAHATNPVLQRALDDIGTATNAQLWKLALTTRMKETLEQLN
jgi:hypothetical protein